jgi:hypothetical protein
MRHVSEAELCRTQTWKANPFPSANPLPKTVPGNPSNPAVSHHLHHIHGFRKTQTFREKQNQTVNAPGNTDVLVLSSPHSITSTVCTIFLFLFFAPWELIIRHMGAPTHCQQFVGCRGNVAKQ